MTDTGTLIGLGTAAIGRPHYINIRQEESGGFSLPEFKAAGRKVLDHAWEQGVRYFDTAPGYGIAEQMILEWLRDNPEKQPEVATKWGYTYTANFDPAAEIHEVKEHSLEKLNEQWSQSRLLLPHLTTYQIHSATFASGVLENEEVLDRLGEIKEKFGLRIGMSVSGSNQLEIVKKALDIERNGEELFEVFQVTYNILDQGLLRIKSELKRRNNRIVVKESLANGRLFPNPDYPHYARLYKEIERIARKYEVGVDAVALRYVMDSLQPFAVLSGASQPLHLSQNLLAHRFRLEEKELISLGRFAVSADSYWEERKKLSWN